MNYDSMSVFLRLYKTTYRKEKPLSSIEVEDYRFIDGFMQNHVLNNISNLCRFIENIDINTYTIRHLNCIWNYYKVFQGDNKLMADFIVSYVNNDESFSVRNSELAEFPIPYNRERASKVTYVSDIEELYKVFEFAKVLIQAINEGAFRSYPLRIADTVAYICANLGGTSLAAELYVLRYEHVYAKHKDDVKNSLKNKWIRDGNHDTCHYTAFSISVCYTIEQAKMNNEFVPFINVRTLKKCFMSNIRANEVNIKSLNKFLHELAEKINVTYNEITANTVTKQVVNIIEHSMDDDSIFKFENYAAYYSMMYSNFELLLSALLTVKSLKSLSRGRSYLFKSVAYTIRTYKKSGNFITLKEQTHIDYDMQKIGKLVKLLYGY